MEHARACNDELRWERWEEYVLGIRILRWLCSDIEAA